MRATTVLLALLLLALPAPAQEAEWLPSDTLFCIAIENWAGQKERFETHPIHALWNAPEMEAFRDAAFGGVKERSTRILEVVNRLHGDAVIAALPEQEDREGLATLIIGNFGKAAPDVTRELDEIDELFGDDDEPDAYESEEEFRGVTIHVSRRRKGEKEKESAYLVHDGRIVAADNVAVLKRALVRRLDGGEDCLARHAPFVASREALGGRPDVTCYVSATGWTSEMDVGGRAVFAALGLDRVQALRAHATLQGNGLRVEALVFAPGAKDGVFKVFAGGAARLGPGDEMPPDVDLAWFFGLDVQDTFDRVLGVLDLFRPGLDATVREAIRQAKVSTGVDIYEDVLGALGSRVTFTWVPADDKPPPDANPVAFGYAFGRRVLTLWEVEDVARLRGAIESAKQVGLVEAAGDYLGTSIYRVGPAGIHVALLPDVAVQAADIEAVRAVLRRYGKDLDGLRAKAAFRAVVAEMPPRPLLFGYSDPNAPKAWSMIDILFDQLRREDDSAAVRALPPASFFRSYRTASGVALDHNEHGLRLTAFLGMRRPEGEER